MCVCVCVCVCTIKKQMKINLIEVDVSFDLYPPNRANIKSNMAATFLKLVDKHFNSSVLRGRSIAMGILLLLSSLLLLGFRFK